MTLPADLESQFDAIRYSDDDLVEKRNQVFDLIKPLMENKEDMVEAYSMAQDIIFPTAELRAVEFFRCVSEAKYNPIAGPLTDAQALRGFAGALRFGATYLGSVSVEAAEEVGAWIEILEGMVDNMKPRRYKCGHCDADCTDTYAVLDGFLLCLTSSGERPSCYTRVHDYGEALGSGKD